MQVVWLTLDTLSEARRNETPLEGSFEVDSERTKSPEGAGLAEMWESSEGVPSGGGHPKTEWGGGCWQPRAESEVSTVARVLPRATLYNGQEKGLG